MLQKLRGVNLPVPVMTFIFGAKKLDLKKVSLLDFANVPSWGSNAETVLEAYEHVIKRYIQNDIKEDDYFARDMAKQPNDLDPIIPRGRKQMRTLLFDGVLEYLENVPRAANLRTNVATMRSKYIESEGECL